MKKEKSATGRIAAIAVLLAIVYSGALVIAGLFAPVYSTESVSSDGDVVSGSASLVSENGLSVLVVLAIPLLVSVLVGVALWQSRRPGMVLVAWTLTGILAAFNVLALLSIGIFIVPVTAALVIACLNHQGGSGPSIALKA